MGGENGCIARLSGNQWEDKGPWPANEEMAVRSMTTTADGGIWALSKGKYLYSDKSDDYVWEDARIARWNGNQWEEIERCPLNDRKSLLFMFTASDGNIQVVDTDAGYATCWNGNQWEDLGRWFDDGTGWLIYAATTALDGSIWVAGIDGMTARLSDNQWETIKLWPELSDDLTIFALTTTPDGVIWAGGDGGYLAYWSGSKWVVNVRWLDGEVGGNDIYTMSAALDGSVWVTGIHGSVACFLHKI
ncbi:hypothetical protein M1N64_04600 [Peptococcaceae bacterium]|nr:hypothetical protein [Peptococcaceae bacterium]